MQEIIRRRLKALWDNTGFSLVDDPLRVGYYSEIDMLVWAKIFYGEEFVDYLKKTYSPWMLFSASPTKPRGIAEWWRFCRTGMERTCITCQPE